MPMRRTFVAYHHCALYVVLVVSAAVTAGAAAWNLSLALGNQQRSVDAYMIFLGALSLLLVLPLITLDVFMDHAYTTRVWVECLWVGALFLFHLPGAVVVTALLSASCDPFAGAYTSFLEACRSYKLLQAFAWITTGNLLLYLLVLLTFTLIHARQDRSVWHAHVRAFDWCELRSPPASPARFNTDIFVAAPRPLAPPAPLPSPSEFSGGSTVEHLAGAPSTGSMPAAYAQVPRGAAASQMAQRALHSLYPSHLVPFLPSAEPAHSSPSPPPPLAYVKRKRPPTLRILETGLASPRPELASAPAPATRRHTEGVPLNISSQRATGPRPMPSRIVSAPILHADPPPTVAPPAPSAGFELANVGLASASGARPVRPNGPRTLTRTSVEHARRPSTDIALTSVRLSGDLYPRPSIDAVVSLGSADTSRPSADEAHCSLVKR